MNLELEVKFNRLSTFQLGTWKLEVLKSWSLEPIKPNETGEP